MQIAGRTIGAALAMGNACVLKPAEEACLTSLALADLAREAGFPAGALNVAPGLGEEAGAALAGHPGVRHLSFTGSVAVGGPTALFAAAIHSGRFHVDSGRPLRSMAVIHSADARRRFLPTKPSNNLRVQPQSAFWRIALVRRAGRSEDVRPKQASTGAQRNVATGVLRSLCLAIRTVRLSL